MIKSIRYSILVLSVSLFFSCKKEPILNDCPSNGSNTNVAPQLNDVANQSASVEMAAASIYYTSISPHYTLQFNVDRDTIIDYLIDLNADQINDFKFSLRRKQYLWCGNPPSYAYGTVISVSSLDNANYITTGNGNIYSNDPYNPYYSPNTQLLDSGVIISNSIYQFNKHAEVLFDKAMALGMFIDFIGDKYIPIVFKNNHFGWIHVEEFDLFQGKIIIKGFAYNGTKNSPIKAGQMSIQ